MSYQKSQNSEQSLDGPDLNNLNKDTKDSKPKSSPGVETPKSEGKSIWQAKAGRHLGTKYQGDSRGCQDYAIAKANDKGAWAIACDGAGSSKHSQKASKAIAEEVSLYFESGNIFTDGTKTSVFKQNEILKNELKTRLWHTLQRLSSEYGTGNLAKDIKDFHTTLLFVYHNFASNQYYLGHIGDGMVVGLTESGLEILSYPETGEGAANQTYFVSHLFYQGGEQYFRTKIKPARSEKYNQDYIGYMCFSDGVEDYVYLRRKIIVEEYKEVGKEYLHPDLLAFFNNLEKLPDLGKVLNDRWIQTGHTDDDCCLAIIKNENKSCELDFKKEHDFYAQALEKQRQADQEYKQEQIRKQKQEEERKRREQEWRKEEERKRREQEWRKEEERKRREQEWRKEEERKRREQERRQEEERKRREQTDRNQEKNKTGIPQQSQHGIDYSQEYEEEVPKPPKKPLELKLQTTGVGHEFGLTINENFVITGVDNPKSNKHVPKQDSKIISVGSKKELLETVKDLQELAQKDLYPKGKIFLQWREPNNNEPREKFIYLDSEFKYK